MNYPKIDRPTEPGRYWYRCPDGAFEIVLVYRSARQKLYVAWVGAVASPFALAEFCAGDWRGPIPEPTT